MPSRSAYESSTERPFFAGVALASHRENVDALVQKCLAQTPANESARAGDQRLALELRSLHRAVHSTSAGD